MKATRPKPDSWGSFNERPCPGPRVTWLDPRRLAGRYMLAARATGMADSACNQPAWLLFRVCPACLSVTSLASLTARQSGS